MLRFLGGLVVLLALVAALGYYRGWFQAQSVDTNGEHTVTVTVDKDKIIQDKTAATQELHDLAHNP